MIQLTEMVRSGTGLSVRALAAHASTHDLASELRGFLLYNLDCCRWRREVSHILELAEAILVHGRLDALQCFLDFKRGCHQLSMVRHNLVGTPLPLPPADRSAGAVPALDASDDYYGKDFEDYDQAKDGRVFSQRRGLRGGLTGRQLALLCGHQHIVSWIDVLHTEEQADNVRLKFCKQCQQMEKMFVEFYKAPDELKHFVFGFFARALFNDR